MPPLVDRKRYPNEVKGRKSTTYYGNLQVCSSGGGYFIGRMCFVAENGANHGYQDMGTRESDYFETREEAQAALDSQNYDDQ